MTNEQMKLHDSIVDANCHIGLWTNLEYRYFGMSRKRIEAFYQEIMNIEKTMQIARMDGLFYRLFEAYNRDN